MKLISYLYGGASHWGCVIDNGSVDGVVDLGRRLPAFASVAVLLEGGDAALAEAREAAAGAAPDHALADVRVETPIARPRRIFCIGVNYAHRNAEYKDGSDLPKYPSIFIRVAGLVHRRTAKPLHPAVRIDGSSTTKARSAIVIGKAARGASKRDQDALACIAGVTCVNEGTIRDWVHHAKFNVTQGKNFHASGSLSARGSSPPMNSRMATVRCGCRRASTASHVRTTPPRT